MCDQLEAEIRDARPLVKAGKVLGKGTILLMSGVAGVVGGVIGSVLTEMVLRRLNLR